MSNIEHSETLICTLKTKEAAEQLRAALVQNFERTWFYVFNVANKYWEIKVASNWGGKLNASSLSSVEEFVNNFVENENIEIYTTRTDNIRLETQS